jgi:hypothetical protein
VNAWIVQFGLWLKFSWPFAKILWEVLRDGKLTLEEVQFSLAASWPHDQAGLPETIKLPWAKRFRTDDA